MPCTAARGKGANVLQASQLAALPGKPLPARGISWSPRLAALAVTLTAALRNSVAHVTAAKTARG